MEATARPNVLWICTDQQRFDTLGCYGNPYVHTPNLDRLAREGVLFTNAFSQCPVCAPSRGSFLTGRYPRLCGPRQNGQDIDPSEILISKWMKDRGYLCGLSGKLHLSACFPGVCPSMERRIDDGYDYFEWSHHPAGYKHNWPLNRYTQWLSEQGQVYETRPHPECSQVRLGMPPEYHQTKWCADKAITFMEAAKECGRPWFFSLNCFDPHHDFDPPEEYLSRYMDLLDDLPLPNYVEGELSNKPYFQTKDHGGAYDTPGHFDYDQFTSHQHRLIKAAYYAMCDFIDVQVGRLMAYLDESGQKENTLVIFTSDHGEHLGDHGMYLKGPCFYENNVHVPLILSMPSRIPGGRKVSSLTELVDLAPTILDLCGLPIYEGMQGISFAPVLLGETDSHCRESVYSEYYNSNIKHKDPKAFCTMVRTNRYKLIKVHAAPDGQKLPPDKYIIMGELYDLEADPRETVNHYNDPAYAAVKCEMLELLADRMAQTCDPLPKRRACW